MMATPFVTVVDLVRECLTGMTTGETTADETAWV